MPKITVINAGVTVEAVPVLSVLNNLGRQGVPVMSVCVGRGNCGTCRYKVVSGGQSLSPVKPPEIARLGDLLNEGWRLGCQTAAWRDLVIQLPPYADPKPVEATSDSAQD